MCAGEGATYPKQQQQDLVAASPPARTLISSSASNCFNKSLSDAVRESCPLEPKADIGEEGALCSRDTNPKDTETGMHMLRWR